MNDHDVISQSTYRVSLETEIAHPCLASVVHLTAITQFTHSYQDNCYLNNYDRYSGTSLLSGLYKDTVQKNLPIKDTFLCHSPNAFLYYGQKELDLKCPQYRGATIFKYSSYKNS